MRAAGRIEAVIHQHEPLNGPAMHQVLCHNLLYVFRLYKAVPYRFRIDDDCGAVFALVKAARFIRANRVFQAHIFHLVLEQAVQLALPVVGAGRSCAAGLAHVGADKYMPLKLGQNSNLLFPSYNPKSPGFPPANSETIGV